ncbi:hypothetical protein WBP07_05705 [Novosphingobium sp. BL-8A]|uniref:hypothetical protein n=1 Tax=Novosphingobium sp. BL-8A TaxID=3127639 RepID=UPI003756BE60
MNRTAMHRTVMAGSALGLALMLSAQAQAGMKPAESVIGKMEQASIGRSFPTFSGFDRSSAGDSQGGGHARGHEGYKSHGC